MDVKYRYGHRPGRRRRTRVLIILAVSLLILGTIVGIIALDLYKHKNKPVSGTSRTVFQALDYSLQKLTIDEPTFTMELPNDWKEIGRQNDKYEHSITWQATKTREDNRILKLYIDTIPKTKSVNYLLPVAAMDSNISLGDISDNCATFTKGGTLNAGQAQSLQDAPAKWEKVDFICDLARVTDREVGTGSTEAINAVTIAGPNKGTHKYFFLFTDHNIQPNYSIVRDAVRSFRAK